MAQPATVPLKPHLRLTSRHLRLFIRASLIPTKSRSRTIPRAVSSTLQNKPLDLKSQHNLSSPGQLRRPNQRLRLEEISEDSAEAVPSSSGSGSSDNNLPSDVLRVMDALKLPLDEELYISLINECTDARRATQAVLVHAHVYNSYAGFIPLHLANRLILMYAACGDVRNAGKLFGSMLVKDSLSWAILISAYSDLPDGHYNAMKLFATMLSQQPVTGEYFHHAIICTLRSCARSRNMEFGLQIHALMIKQIGLPEAILGDLGSALVQFYCMVDCCDAALLVFDEMRSYLGATGLSAWSSAITSCNRDGRFEEAILLFRQMAMSGKKRESNSLSCALTASAKVGTNGLSGKQIHADAIKHGLDSEPFVATSLVHMYSHQGLLTEAARSFEAIERPDEASWRAMLASYTRNGLFDEAVKVLYRMKAAGVQPTEHMLNEVKMACTS